MILFMLWVDGLSWRSKCKGDLHIEGNRKRGKSKGNRQNYFSIFIFPSMLSLGRGKRRRERMRKEGHVDVKGEGGRVEGGGGDPRNRTDGIT